MKKIDWLKIVLLSAAAAGCGKETNSLTLGTGFSQDELKRFSQEDFNTVHRRLYYGGVTAPIATLPRDAERGILVFEDGAESNDLKNARRIADLLGRELTGLENVEIGEELSKDVVKFYREQFGRNSFDDAAATINISVDVNRDFKIDSSLGHNAAWIEEKSLFFFGAGGGPFKPFVVGSDVFGHEFTHAVVSSTSKLEYVGQTGALNEHFADVFGEMFQSYEEESEPSFLVGETIAVDSTKPLRDMLNPELGMARQPGSVAEIPEKFGADCKPSNDNDNCGVHILSGIPNKYAALVIKKLGWLKTRDLFYEAMTERLTSQSNFADYAAVMRELAGERLSGDDAAVVDESLIAVGL